MGESLDITAPFCLIHSASCGQDILTNLTSPRDFQSWCTLLEAARVHRFKPLLDLAAKVGDGVIPPVFYHLTCRNTFVHSLNKPCSVTLDHEFCDDNIKNTAAQWSVKAKEKVRLQSSRRFHPDISDDTESNCDNPSTRAFEFVVEHISNRLSKEILSLEDITTLYSSKLAEYEQTDLCEDACPMDLKSKLEQRFGQRLRFSQVEINGHILMYPDTLAFDDLLKWIFEVLRENYELKENLDKCKCTSCTVVDASTQTEETVDEDNYAAADIEVSEVESVELGNTSVSDQPETVETSSIHLTEKEPCDSNVVNMETEVDNNKSHLVPEKEESCVVNTVNNNTESFEAQLLKARMDVDRLRWCVCHVNVDGDTRDEKIIRFSLYSWGMVCKYAAIWKDLDGIHRIVATQFDTATAFKEGFHGSCYLRFACRANVATAFKRLVDTQEPSANCGTNSESAACSQSTGKSRKRTSIGNVQHTRIGECIFCRREKKAPYSSGGSNYVYSWNRDSRMLVSIRQAAKRLKDEGILQLIRQADVEPGFVLKGHRGCYGDYIVRKEGYRPGRRGRRLTYVTEFQKFCTDIIDKRIMQNGEMLATHVLTKMLVLQYIDPSRTVFKSSDSDYYNWSSFLRLRIEKQYGDDIAVVHVNGQNAYLFVSKTRLQQILADADLEQQNEAGGDVLLEQPVAAENPDTTRTQPEVIEALYPCIACHKSFESCVQLDLHHNENSSCSARYLEIIKNAAEFGVDISAITRIPNLQRYNCEICLRCYNTMGLLQKHAKVHVCEEASITNTVPKKTSVLYLYFCQKCDKWFRKIEQFELHMGKVHESKSTSSRHQCTFCFEEFTEVADHQLHIRNFHSVVYLCQYCNMQFRNPEVLKRHTFKRHLATRVMFFACAQCNQLFRRSHYGAFKEHISRSHRAEKSFCCEICGKLFLDVFKLKSHMDCHTDIKQYLCEFCCVSFRHASTLKNHIADHHSEPVPYICQDCGKCFPNVKRLKYHIYSHSGLKPFICTVCSKGFGTKHLLRQHGRSHTKPYACEICYKRFANRWSLKLHMKAHQDMTLCKVDTSENISAPVCFYADSDIASVCREVELAFTPFIAVDAKQEHYL